MPTRLRIATINMNGIRAAYRKGMGDWLDDRGIDILAMQEVRASTDDLEQLLGAEWDILHDPATAKGRAGVALASRQQGVDPPRGRSAPTDFDSAGTLARGRLRGGRQRSSRSSARTCTPARTARPKQVEKYKFLDAMTARLPELAAHSELAVVLGDLNVGHRELDIRNWKGNLKTRRIPPQGARLLRPILRPRRHRVDRRRRNGGPGLGWVDVGRRFAGEVDGPYTWWSSAARRSTTTPDGASTTTLATPALAATVVDYTRRPRGRAGTSDGRTTPRSSSTTRI